MKDAIEKALPGILPPAGLQPISESRQFNHISSCVPVVGIRQTTPYTVTANKQMVHNRNNLLRLNDLAALGTVASGGHASMLAGCLHSGILDRLVYMRRGRRGRGRGS